MLRRRAWLLAALPLVAVPGSAYATRCGTASALDEGLRATALAAVEAKNRYLVTGDAAALAGWPAAARPAVVTERATLASSSVTYTWSTASIAAFEITSTGTGVVLHAEVSEELGMAGIDGNTGVPASTGSRTKYHFSFVPHGDGWRLAAVRADHFGDPYVDCS